MCGTGHGCGMPRRPGPASPAQLSATPVPPVLLARELPFPAVRALLSGGTLTRVRTGAYLATELLADRDAHERLRVLTLARVRAVSSSLTADVVVSHLSAAAVWGLPIVTASTTVHVVSPSRASARSSSDIDRHWQRLPANDVTEHRGIPVTTLERTVVDCACALPVREALILADAALHIGADIDSCWRIVGRMKGHRGIRAARAVLEYADGGSESPGETTARLAFLRAGLPRPVTQLAVETRLGTFWVDLGWPEQRVLGEYDGRSKYADAGAPAAVVIEEKRREDALVEQGFRVIRIDADDVRHPETLAARLRRLGSFPPPILRPELSLYGPPRSPLR